MGLLREIERLKTERRQLEFHVERTGTENSTKVCHYNVIEGFRAKRAYKAFWVDFYFLQD